MNCSTLTIYAIALIGLSGLPSSFVPSSSKFGKWLPTVFVVVGAIAGLWGVFLAADAAGPVSTHYRWVLPWGGTCAITIDSISIVFLCLIYVVAALGSVYAQWYWKQSYAVNGRRLAFFYGLLAGAMALVVIASDGILFLIAWEIMALAAFFAATVEDENVHVRQAGWVYLIATHIGTLCLIAMFAFWNHLNGSFSLEPITVISAGAGGTIFILALIGFGCKAGIMPLHVWLPGAHANAPSHISALMSGVMLKMGIYGIVRMTSLLPTMDVWWGYTLLIAGVVTGIAGITFAISQTDLKRILAYSSIENIGIICIALGLALVGRKEGRVDLIILGLSSALLHVWNHGLFKSLLFLNAGAIVHATHTREIDAMGGLGKRMPFTMLLFIIGSIAICALPPLNGFVSEWLLYIGSFRTIFSNPGENIAIIALGAVALALIGPLAIACFVRLGGTVFSGLTRSDSVDGAHDPSPGMLLPMALLAVGCLFIGIYPQSTIPLLSNAAQVWAGMPLAEYPVTSFAPLWWITIMSVSLLILIGVVTLLIIIRQRLRKVVTAGTWDCGYAHPTAKMQYTGSSFGNTIVTLFSFILLPKSVLPNIYNKFPSASKLVFSVSDTILDRLLLPLFRFAGLHLPKIRVLQMGQTHLYVLYILVILIFLILWG